MCVWGNSSLKAIKNSQKLLIKTVFEYFISPISPILDSIRFSDCLNSLGVHLIQIILRSIQVNGAQLETQLCFIDFCTYSMYVLRGLELVNV